ncbi:ATP binding domain family protein [Naegleria gruberi]|uniref:GPN-loop GTPase 3 n=1 Tax=Naegleria gruberi TaxID=5762 RepID=D2V936_NAEGR|nr:ATP binding domain family protein [Naegleria gruberi]EFC46522.1 ATP binding domain family protein [Naegleria gruberi]|eukprot:XP_002679266.1 ATP binding domain family protein [Naegleria gruberi strain NEG-M]
MGKHAQLVIGPAGSGKSTYCQTIQEHGNNTKRVIHVVNLDPAAEEFKYQCAFDIRDLVTLEDVMEEFQLGPNGGLVYCMEYLMQNLEDWFSEELSDYENDYLIFDCPGQIELYSHVPIMQLFVKELERRGYRVCCVYCMDVQFIEDVTKYISGITQALSAMIQFETPHVNIFTKCDTLKGNKERSNILEKLKVPDKTELLYALEKETNPHKRNSSFSKLNHAIVSLIDNFNMVGFLELDITDEESIEYILSYVDMTIQYGEDEEAKEPKEETEESTQDE